MNWELHESKKLAFCIVCQCYIVIVYIGVDSVSPYCVFVIQILFGAEKLDFFIGFPVLSCRSLL